MRWNGTVAGAIAACLLVASGHAGPGEATQFVKGVLDRAMEIQTQPDLQGAEKRTERARRIRGLIGEKFQGSAMARASLSNHWQKLSKAQQDDFERLFVDLFQDSYTRMVINYLRQETVEYLGEREEDAGVQVQTKIMRVNEHIPVAYRLVKMGQRWQIVDVDIDGVSIVRNYQGSFHRVITSQSVEELLKKMRLQSQAIKEAPAS